MNAILIYLLIIVMTILASLLTYDFVKPQKYPKPFHLRMVVSIAYLGFIVMIISAFAHVH